MLGEKLMKRKAIILVNDDGKLPGLSKDSDNIVSFLKSLAGGSWFDSEIEIIKNPSLTNLKLKLALQRLTPVDLCLVFFSGHGGNDGRKTHLQINNQKETIEESALFGFAEKQINFFDCCRVIFFDDRNVSSLLKYFTFGSKQRVFKQRYNRHRSYATGHGCNE